MTPSKQSYFHVEMDRGTIRFPSHLSSSSVEIVLSEAYRKSHYKKYATLCFDFSYVLWCDLMPMTLITNWILSLCGQKKNIEFHFPADQAVHRFLSSYRFEKFLDESNVSKLRGSSVPVSMKPIHLQIAPFFPLTFLNEEAFRHFLGDLYYGDRLETVFAGLEMAEIVKTGAVRDILLYELGDNIYVHAAGEYAHIAMTKFSKPYLRKSSHPLNEIDSRFYSGMRGREVLEVVISDMGPGFRGTLLQTYFDDLTISDRPSSPTDCDLIEYALLSYTSRRSVAERIGRILDIISGDAINFPPPTGLFRLKETIREYRGLLYIRSGTGIVAYDFLSDQHSNAPYRSDNLSGKHALSLCSMPGIQYRIVLPVRKPPQPAQQAAFPFEKASRQAFGTYEYLAVSDFFPKDKPGDFQSAAESLDTLFNALNTLSSQNKDKYLVVVVDFCGCEHVSAKALHYLIHVLMQRQGQLQTNIVLNFPLATDMEYFRSSRSASCRPMQVYDNHGSSYILGLSSGEISLVGKLLQGGGDITSESQHLEDSLPHLLAYDDQEQRYALRVDYYKALRISREAIGKRLKTAILDQIFDPNIKVLLPSQRYSSGYFETYRIYKEPLLYRLLKSYLTYSLKEVPFDFVISIGQEVGAWVQDVLSDPPFSRSIQRSHISLTTGSRGRLSIAPILGIAKNSRVIVISDVLGTCNTVLTLLKNISQTTVVKIVAIVNASVDAEGYLEVRELQYPIEAIVRKSLKYYYDLPQGWFYSEVHQVDPQTHLLVRNVVEVQGPILKGIKSKFIENVQTLSNEFFMDIVEPSNGIREGHFSSKSSHIVYLFDIPRIMALFSDHITERIIDDIKAVENVLPEERRDPITHVLFPHYNPGIDILAKRVAKEFAGCAILKVSEREMLPSLDQEGQPTTISKAVIIDDATVTGETVFRMIDISERMGAHFIYVYIVIKRCDAYTARRLEKTRQYGRSTLHIRYLVDAELPSYPADKCPLCTEKSQLEDLIDALGHNPALLHYFVTRLRDQQMQPVEVVLEESKLLSMPTPTLRTADYLSLCYRWLLEYAKGEPVARHLLAEVTRAYEEKPSDVLILFSILEREKVPSILSAQLRKDLFYESFCEDIIKACRYFLGRIETLDIRELRSVLYMSEEFDLYYVTENLSRMLLQCSSKIPNLIELTVHVIRSKVFRDHPAHVTQSLRNLHDAQRDNKQVVDLINSLSGYSEKKERQAREQKTDRFAAYVELRGGVFHEIEHLRTNLASAISDPITAARNIEREWEALRLEIDKILSLVKRAIGFEVMSPACSALDALLSSVNFQVGEINRILLSPERGQDNSREQVKEIALRISELLFGNNGIRMSLNLFETNVKTVTWAIIQQHEKNLYENGILVERIFPEGLCMLYGEERDYKLILHNLIENVWKWSHGTRLLIVGEFIEDAPYMIVRMLDDGGGLGAKITKGHGLRNVEHLVHRYYGEFNPNSEIPGRYQKDGFATSISLTIPRLRPIKEEIS